ncbi:uncharacterized protein LOC117640481 [Thrips palmi]|uniref:Regulatory protein zeste n=1 Tax=Thrips palmi TaxID=161013 RepID=A0A6P8Y8C3_THRPL|nr:uncharacterized protein LOC117640481 [Thrips palmi]
MGARPEQWNCLMDILAHDKELLHGDFKGPNGVIRTRQRWEDIAAVLNQIPGDQKDGAGWKESWNKLKLRARDACRKRAAYMAGTGGGPVASIVGLGLSALHERVINLTGLKAALGSHAPDPLQIQLDMAQAEVVDEPQGVAQAPAQVAQAAEAAHAAPPAQPAEAAHPAPPVQPPHAGQAAQAAPLPEAGQAAPPVQPPEAGQAVQAAQPPQAAQVAQAAQPVAFVVLDDEALLGEAAGPVAGVEPDLVPFKWENEDDNDVLFLDLLTPVKNKVEVKLEPVEAQIKEEGGIGGMYHTPPRESGLTPSCKRRPTRDHTRHEGCWGPSDTRLSIESRYEAVIRHNTIVMQEVLKVMQNFNLQF